MGSSGLRPVTFLERDRYQIKFFEHENGESEDDAGWTDITHKALKKLEAAESGDIIEIDISYDARGYPIVDARRVTGSAEELVRLLSERVARLEAIVAGLPEIIRAATDEIRGDRYEDSKRVHHAVAMAIEQQIARDGKPKFTPVRIGGSPR